jgi:hypothetical protein
MKTKKYFAYILALSISMVSCEQDVIDLTDPELDLTNVAPDTCPDGASKGSADFTNFVAIGNSFVAGVQGGALFTEGQNSSLPALMNKQFECVGASADFDQPDINAELGYNLFVTQPFLTGGPTNPILGKLALEYTGETDCGTDDASVLPVPQAYAVGNLEALPNPTYNPGFIYGNGSTKPDLNNFGVPAVLLGQSISTATGNWGATSDPRFSPFYARMEYPGNGSATMVGDVIEASPTFFLFWLGLDDFFLHAAYGADPAKAPLTSATSGAPYGFNFQYPYSISLLMDSDPDLKGVVGNFPDIFKMPHFTAVSYNPIPLDASSAAQLNAGFDGYNDVLDAIIASAALQANFGLDAAELATRKLSWSESCNNKILLIDETLDDLGDVFDYLRSVNAIDSDAKRQALIPYEQVRQSTSADVIPLRTGSVLGTDGTFFVAPGVKSTLGVNEALKDEYVIIPSEKTQINDAREAYNAIVAATVATYSTRLALADIDAEFDALVAAGGASANGVFYSPVIDPPTGIYSEDGVHPNTRGYAVIANMFIEAINAKFGASVPLLNISRYSATGLPL